MVKPERVSYERKFNIGNYENITVHVEGSIDLDETVEQALARLERMVMNWWHSKPTVKIAEEIGKEVKPKFKPK